jgi:hypothetical protein
VLGVGCRGEEGEWGEGRQGGERRNLFVILFPLPFTPSPFPRYYFVNEPELRLSPQRLDLFSEVSVKHKSTIS